MTIPVPMLSAAGWVRSPSEKADALISHAYLSDKSQTALYGDNVMSVQQIIERYSHDTTGLAQALRIEFERYFSRFYESASVDITAEDPQDGSGKITLRLYCVVTEGAKKYSFGKLLLIKNSKIEEIIAINNTEPAI
jgi:hypothetical protein